MLPATRIMDSISRVRITGTELLMPFSEVGLGSLRGNRMEMVGRTLSVIASVR